MKHVAVVVLYTPDRRILLQERGGISKQGEDWAIFGGSLEEGETPDQAIVREIEEELEYRLAGHVKRGVHHIHLRGIDFAIHYYTKGIDGIGSFRLHEGSGMRLFTFAEAKRLNIMPGHDAVLEKVERLI